MDEATLLALREEQKLWEVEAVERGVRRYRSALNKTLAGGGEADTGPGQKMMVDIVKHLTPAIERAQEEGGASLTTGQPGAPLAWALPLSLLDAEKWAYITGRTILSSGRDGRPVASLARTIASVGRTEMEFEKLKEAEAKKAKSSEGYVSMVDRMARRMPTFSLRTVKRWMRKCDTYVKEGMTEQVAIQLGSKLVHLAISNGGGWFHHGVVASHDGGRYTTKSVVRLSPTALEYLNYHHAQSELTRPWLTPMLCPPNDWVKLQQSRKEQA